MRRRGKGHMKGAMLCGASLLIGSLIGCKASEDSHGIGFRDGYAVGYNTTCEIRTTMVHGDWKDEDYSKGYAEGMTSGIADCNADRRSGTVK